MQKYIFFLLWTAGTFLPACSQLPCPPDGAVLDAAAFSEKMKTCPDAVLLDVRTPEEFAKGHLPDARNVDWSADGFENGIASLDKSKTVFVYCLSGARSAAAAAKMRSDGYEKVIEMQGGILKWRGAHLPEVKGDERKTAGMPRAAFDVLLQTDKLVLIDFYADWCAPCKKMAPYLEEIKSDMAGRVEVVRINADDNQLIVRELGIDALPVLLLYKNGVQVWKNEGFIEKADVVSQLETL